MKKVENLTVTMVTSKARRERALGVLDSVYQAEKGWVKTPDQVFPVEDLGSSDTCWFLAELKGLPVGVMRVLYEIPHDLYKQYQLEVVDPRLDIEAFLHDNRLAEVGRFAVVPDQRGNIRVAAALMRAATLETLERGCSHFITDVFEADANSPYEFHRRILGFEVVATHEKGELAVASRRITMLLDLHAALKRLNSSRSWIFRSISQGWNDALLARYSA